MANPFVHVELQTNDLAKAKAFYSKLFDWKLEDAKMPDGETYTMINVGEGTGGGMYESKALAGKPPHWLAYVLVNDVSSSTRKAKELGAKAVMDKTEVGGFGFMSIVVDPTGATFALWEAKPRK
ncbi:MAG: VOC family protein [Myxococcales bacterium]|nr:VOC family protein [Myxococcales bacterium]